LERLQTWASGTFTTTDAKQHEEGTKSAVYGWLHELQDAGFLEQEQAGRGSAPAKWRLTGKALDEAGKSILPTVEEVFVESTDEVFGESTWNNGHKPQLIEAQ
jgi:DNA-binding PadR family transcriptional regulator